MKDRAVIGLCGRSGSGKSYVCKVFSSFGGLHLDTDRIYHDLLLPSDGVLSPCSAALSAAFGEDIIGEDMTPNSKKLGSIVFSDPEKLDLLNKITHKYIFEKTMQIVNETCAPFYVMDAPVLFESGFDKYCDFTVCVTADDEICIERIMKRDGADRERAVKRLSAQISVESLRERCDYEIVNNGTEDIGSRIKNILIETGLYHEI